MKYFIFSLLASGFVTFLIVQYRHLHSHISADHDLHGVQKCHIAPVPRIGGVGIFAALLSSLLFLFAFDSSHTNFVGLFLLPASIVFAVGLIEDLTKRVSVRMRLSVTMLAALLGCFLIGETVRSFDVPVIDSLFQINVIALAFTIFAVAGVSNAVNLIDGFNGLSSGISVTALLALGFVSYQIGDDLLVTLALASAGAVIGFMIWNYPKAKIFLGDGGAYLVGFVIAEISILLNERHQEVSVLFPLLVMLYPIFETLFTVYRRKFVRGVSPGAPDAMHLHQLIHKRLVRWSIAKKSEPLRTRGNPATSPYLWALNLAAVLPAVLFWNSPLGLATSALAFMATYVWLYHRLVTFQVPSWLVRHRPLAHGASTIAITANTAWHVVNFKSGLIKALQDQGIRVVVFASPDEYVPRLLDLGCHYCELPSHSSRFSPIKDLRALRRYLKLLKQHQPAVLLTFTPKANIYGALAARMRTIPTIANFPHLGDSLASQNWLTPMVSRIYRVALRHPIKVFFQNKDDQSIFLNMGFVREHQVDLLPSAAVNIVKFSPPQSNQSSRPFTFMLAARLLWDRGIAEFVEAASIIKKLRPELKFQLVGLVETDNPSAIPASRINAWESEGIIEYLGATNNVPAQLANADCFVLPSYQKDAHQPLLEAASMALPIITSDATNCRRTIDDGVSGYVCKAKDVDSLIDCMLKMLALPEEERHKMGTAGRNKMKRLFNEQIVFDAYIEAIEAVRNARPVTISHMHANQRIKTMG
jgi:UDP-GlcNAc:undecaprenyl-phosphate/decaprenyl-phosphate GlcNAc-1-phosphate transferase